MDLPLDASEAPVPRSIEAASEETGTEVPASETPAARLARLRAEREELEQQMEIDALEEQIERMREARELAYSRNAGHTPAAQGSSSESVAPGDSAASYAGASSVRDAGAAHVGLSSGRPRLREPRFYKGKTLKEARAFIKELEVIFALARGSYQLDHEKVLYGVMFLAGEPYETWHHAHDVGNLGDYTFEDFRRFVLDAVEDPVNRSISVTLSYEKAVQKEGQSIQSFAADLATIEEQMAPYTEEQRVRHLLAKLTPALRTAIIKYHTVPTTRQDLVSLGARIESTDKNSAIKRDAGDSYERGSRKRQKEFKGKPRGDRVSQEARRDRSFITEVREETKKGSSDVTCWGCGKTGHYKTECRSRHLWPDSVRKVNKVSASAPRADQPEKGKGQDLAKSRT